MRWLNTYLRRRTTARQRAERATDLSVPTQDIGQVKAQRRAATINGLLVKLPPEKREAVAAKFEAAIAAKFEAARAAR